MFTWLEGGAVETIDSEVLVRFLGKKGWNEKNFQVSSLVQALRVQLIRPPGFRKAIRNFVAACGQLPELCQIIRCTFCTPFGGEAR